MGGIFGVVSEGNCAKTLFYGTDYHSHLGTENAGLAVLGEGGFCNTIHSISQAQFKSRFVDDYKAMNGSMGIGAIDDESPQPLIIRSKFGTYALAATGLITNKDELTGNLLKEGASFSEMADGGVNSVELVAQADQPGREHRRRNRPDAAGDRGIGLPPVDDEGGDLCRPRPVRAISPGRSGRKSGTTAVRRAMRPPPNRAPFPTWGMSRSAHSDPGEIVRLDRTGIHDEHPAGNEKQVCAFLWIYTGYPSSVYEGISVENARERCGQAMARGDDVEADFVTGVPDSGVGHAIGYAMESGLPFRRPLVKYTPGYGRSYTPPSQDIRDLVATMKLSAVRDVIKGNRMVVCDDSIVRGTQLKNYTIRKLWDNGAKEIHIRPACPPLDVSLPVCLFHENRRRTGFPPGDPCAAKGEKGSISRNIWIIDRNNTPT